MPKLLVVTSFLMTLLGCATTSRFDTGISLRYAPPTEKFLDQWRLASTQELEALSVGKKENQIMWWKLYRLAQLKQSRSPEISCNYFQTLSADKDFPLKDLALLRAHEVCTQPQNLPPVPTEIAPWLRDLAVSIRLKEAEMSPDTNDDLEALSDFASLQTNKKNKEEQLQKALSLARNATAQDKIAKLESALFQNSPRLKPSPLPEELTLVAMDFRHHREFDQALKTYEKIISLPKVSQEDQFQALKSIRQTLKVAQRKEDYIKASFNLVTWAKKNYKKNKKDSRAIARLHEAQVTLAKTLWTEDQTSKAIEILNETARLLRGLYSMDEVYYLLGRIEEEKGNLSKSLELLEASYKEAPSVGGLKDKIAWVKSWTYYKLGQWENAKSSFEQMRDSVKDSTDKARASFWLSRSLIQLQKNQEAKNELEKITQQDPLGYYGILAIRELKRDFTPIQKKNDERTKISLMNISDLTPKMRLTALWLIAVNEKSTAEKVLNMASDELRQKSGASSDSWLALSSAYAQIGLYLPFFSAISPLSAEMKERLLKQYPELLFPRSFQEIISKAAEQSGTPKEFIYSIIRQESAFNPEARSSADAFGLMQLLPPLGQRLAKQHSIPFSQATDLFKPEINVPLGAFELKALMDKYNNQFILAVSGYNANDQAIQGWIKTRFREDPIEFIEEVPYDETRAYIKLVLRNYVFYQRIFSNGNPVPFPENLLALRK